MNPEGSNCRRFQVTQEGRYNVSCNWARNNVERWTAWVPVRTNCYAGFLVWIKFCFLVGSLCLNAATSSIYIGELSYKKQGPDPFGEGLVRVQGPPAFCRVRSPSSSVVGSNDPLGWNPNTTGFRSTAPPQLGLSIHPPCLIRTALGVEHGRRVASKVDPFSYRTSGVQTLVN